MTSFLPIVDGQDTPQRYKFNTTYEKSYVLSNKKQEASMPGGLTRSIYRGRAEFRSLERAKGNHPRSKDLVIQWIY